MPLRSATADTVAPGSSASVRTLTFCSAVQRLRRSTREMISPTLSIGVLTHVFKDANAHDLRQHNKGSSGLTLTDRLRRFLQEMRSAKHSPEVGMTKDHVSVISHAWPKDVIHIEAMSCPAANPVRARLCAIGAALA